VVLLTHMLFGISSIAKACIDIFLTKLREIFKDLLISHTCGEISKDIIYDDTQASHTGLTIAFARIYCNDLPVV